MFRCRNLENPGTVFGVADLHCGSWFRGTPETQGRPRVAGVEGTHQGPWGSGDAGDGTWGRSETGPRGRSERGLLPWAGRRDLGSSILGSPVDSGDSDPGTEGATAPGLW